jgi:Fur family ferric uptake transcriptional regulator
VNDNNKILEKDNLRKTKARNSILTVLKENGPKTIEELYDLVQAQNEKFSLSTIYRTCETLTEKGILVKSNMTDGKARYEFNCTEHRHHAVCMDCHRIIPIEDCPFGEFSKLMETKYDFDVHSHKIEILGYCQDCKANHKDENEK